MATNIDGVKILDTDVFTDHRGDLWTTWKKDEFPYDINFNHDKVSSSRKRVLRGIHGDYKSTNFVYIDNREESETYLEWNSIILNDRSRKLVLLPPGVGNGFLVLSDFSIFSYKWSYEGNYPDVDEQFTLKWNDPLLQIDWPINNPILQLRDK